MCAHPRRLNPKSELRRIEPGSPTDSDGGVDAYMFSAGSCLDCNTSGHFLFNVRVLFCDNLRELDMFVYRLDFPHGRANLNSSASIVLTDISLNIYDKPGIQLEHQPLDSAERL